MSNVDNRDEGAKNGDETQDGVSRREALKRIGVAGVVWTAPVTMSFFTAADAVSPPPVDHPECAGAVCDTFIPCSSTNGDCICVTSDSSGFCVPGSTQCADLVACGPPTSGFSCPAGSFCAFGTCCGSIPVCIPIALTAECPPDSGFAGRSAARVPVAGTIGG